MRGGAKWPDISPDGSTIVFVGYTADGFDLFTMPYPVDQSSVAQASGPAADAGAPPGAASEPTSTFAYSPWATLRPTSWTPIVESDSTQLRVGAATGGVDVLGYHAYSASATWLV